MEATADVKRLIWEAIVFVEVADSPNLKAAAKTLGISQSSVTECLDRLERRLFDNRPLIERRGDPRQLTMLGGTFLPAARTIASAARRFEHQTEVIAGERPVIQVGTIQGAWHDVLAAACAKLAAPPDIQLSVLNPFTPAAPLLAGQVRWALLPAPSDHDDLLDRRPVFTEPRMVSLAANHPLASKGTVTLSEVDDLPWLGIPDGSDRAFTAGHRCADIRPEGRIPPMLGPPVVQPAEIGLAIGSGRVVVPTTLSISRLFNLETFGIVDVLLADAPPWQVDIAVSQEHGTGTSSSIDELAEGLRAAAADIDGLTAV